jgi:hypothetical protein
MRRTLFVLFVGLVCCVNGCGSNAVRQHEAIADELFELMEEYVAILEEVDDETTAAEAATKIDVLNGKFQSTYERYRKLPPISTEEDGRLGEKMENTMKKIEPRMNRAAKNIGKKAGANHQKVIDAMNRLTEMLRKFQPNTKQ